jgi:hypothetical protein
VPAWSQDAPSLSPLLSFLLSRSTNSPTNIQQLGCGTHSWTAAALTSPLSRLILSLSSRTHSRLTEL